MASSPTITTNASRHYSSTSDSCLFTPLEYPGDGDIPTEIAYPHQYEPHDVAKAACIELQLQLQDFPNAKMIGVLVVRDSATSQLGFLRAYSGQQVDFIEAKDVWCPPVFGYQTTQPKSFWKEGEQQLERITLQIAALEHDPQRQEKLKALDKQIEAAEEALTKAKKRQKKAKKERKAKRIAMEAAGPGVDFEEELRQESAFYQREVKACKAELLQLQQAKEECGNEIATLQKKRSKLSNDLTNRIFEGYQFLNARGESKNLLQLFRDTALKFPPGGAGDCAAIKLFQTCFTLGYKPIALAEFYWNPTGKGSNTLFRHGQYSPCCRGKCEPILVHMLQGLPVQPNPLEANVGEIIDKNDNNSDVLHNLEIVYKDTHMIVVNKPAEILSVPGKTVSQSVQTEMRRRYPNATGPLLCHRLDLSTSGLLVVALTKTAHYHISKQFADRSIQKRYECLLEGVLPKSIPKAGKLDLPLAPDFIHRPMQMVDFESGKSATTHYEIQGVERRILKDKSLTGMPCSRKVTRVHLYPHTGRTHQLRVHAAHPQGLNLPMVGDDIYGKREERLCLHAGLLQLRHPVTDRQLRFEVEVPF
ncbi:MAG: hypothetical protein SGARI_001758 [Bacillariaceae sp.]